MTKVNKSNLGYKLNKEYEFKIIDHEAVIYVNKKEVFRTKEHNMYGDKHSFIKAEIAIYDYQNK